MRAINFPSIHYNLRRHTFESAVEDWVFAEELRLVRCEIVPVSLVFEAADQLGLFSSINQTIFLSSAIGSTKINEYFPKVYPVFQLLAVSERLRLIRSFRHSPSRSYRVFVGLQNKSHK